MLWMGPMMTWRVWELFAVEKTGRFWLSYAQKMKAGRELSTHTHRKGFSKNRSWTSSLTMKSKILADWKMALDELLEGSSIWESCGLELMNQETQSTFSFLKLLFVFIHKVCLNSLPWGADWGAGSGFQSHISCERLCLLLHLSIISWSSHETRILDQRVNLVLLW